MKFLKHLLENPFITATGLAALPHSTWSLGTLFSGKQPESIGWAWLAWVLPAFFMAFALDVGQISTSAKIRHKGLNWRRGIAFFAFSIATYYLQFLYIAHHMPALDITTGVSAFHQWAVMTARDAAIWILPLLLPLSTMLYTIGDGDEKEQAIEQEHSEPIITIESPILPLLEEKSSDLAPSDIEPIPTPIFAAYCPDCGWSKDYDDSKKADRALNTHKSIHCKAKHEIEEVNQNEHVG